MKRQRRWAEHEEIETTHGTYIVLSRQVALERLLDDIDFAFRAADALQQQAKKEVPKI